MYTLFILVTSLSHIFFLRFFRSDGMRGKFGFFLSTLIGFYTHYFYLLLFFIQSIYIFSKSIKSKNIKILLKYLLTVLPAVLLFSPWAYYAWKLGGASNTQPQIPPPTSYNIFQTFILFLFGFQPDQIQSLFVALWPILLSILFLAFTQRKRVPIININYFLGVTFLPVIIVFVISFIRPIFLARYLIFIIPTMFFLISSMLLNYSKKVSAFLIVLFLFTMGGLLIYQNVSARTPVKENYELAADHLTETASSSDIVVVSAPFTVYPVEYYYHGRAKIDTIPRWNRYQEGGIPEFSMEQLEAQIEEYKQSYSNLHILLSYDQGYEDDIRNYLDNNLELIETEDFSEGVQLRVYKLRYDIFE
jgi:mannosyltransferase